MKFRVLFFGMIKDITGSAEMSLDMPLNATLGDVFEHLAGSFPKLRSVERSIVLARNQQFATRVETVNEGDEIALLPPVSGGTSLYIHAIEDSEGHFFALTREEINAEDLRRRLLRGSDGAMVLFEGVVRNNTKGRATKFLDYEGYESMAIQVMAKIGREIASSNSGIRIGMIHRLGRLSIGEASVTVAVSSPHRQAAFDAALEGINRLKKLVPIWKKEHFEDGEVWVEGDWDASVAAQ